MKKLGLDRLICKSIGVGFRFRYVRFLRLFIIYWVFGFFFV